MSDDRVQALAAALLRGPEAPPAAGRSRVGGILGAVLGSMVFAYLAVALVAHNVSARGLLRDAIFDANRRLEVNRWLRLFVGTQKWAMFAPDPYRANTYVRVFAIDRHGQAWDLGHDSYRRRSYPYLFYDRMGKVNRRLVERASYRRPYAAWVCREWARTHDGEPPEAVRFVHMWAGLVPPARSHELGGFDPDRLNVGRKEVDTFVCAGLEHGQLSPELRARYGFAPTGKVPFKELPSRSWVHRGASRAGPPPGDDDDEEGGGW